MKTKMYARQNQVAAKTECQLCTAIERLTVGRTQVINGHVVTRWTRDTYEIGTFGRTTATMDETVDAILAAA